MAQQSLEEMFQEVFLSMDKRKQSQPYKLMIGQDTHDMINAKLRGDTEKVKEISARVHEKSIANHERNKKDFISLYGQEVFDFIDKIKSARSATWMQAVHHPYSITVWSWYTIVETEDGDEYADDGFDIHFMKGKFSYDYYIAGGYAGTGKVEADISMDRVLQLISEHPEGHSY